MRWHWLVSRELFFSIACFSFLSCVCLGKKEIEQWVIDLDGNGLSDIWEQQYEASGLIAEDDEDGDDLSNLEENILWTNPFVEDPWYSNINHDLEDKRIELDWLSRRGVGYRIYRSIDGSAESWEDTYEVLKGDGQRLSASLPLELARDGLSRKEIWYDLEAPTIDSLRSDSRFPDFPSKIVVDGKRGYRPEIEAGEYSGIRQSGHIVVDETEIYTLALRRHHYAEFYLSADSDPANLRLVGTVDPSLDNGQLPHVSYTRYFSIPLQAGEYYYFEYLECGDSNNDEFGDFTLGFLNADSYLQLEKEEDIYFSRFGSSFIRLEFESLDEDEDGLAFHEELVLGYDPQNFNTSGAPSSNDSQEFLDQIGIKPTLNVELAPLLQFFEASEELRWMRISRNGSPLRLPLEFEITGSAEKDVDFRLTPSDLVFPIGVDEILVSIEGVPDADEEGDEFLKLKILDSSEYELEGDWEFELSLKNSPEPTTPFWAALRTGNPAGSFGSGTVTIRVGMEERYATVSVEHKSLNGNAGLLKIIEKSSDEALFTLDLAIANSGFWDFETTVFEGDIVQALESGEIVAKLETDSHPEGELEAHVYAESQVDPYKAPPEVLAFPSTPEEAARFLNQATINPAIDSIQRVQDIGYEAWIDEQIAAPRDEEIFSYWDDTNQVPWQTREMFFEGILKADNQLRYRMALALSEFFVVSQMEPAALSWQLAYYFEMLQDNAFGTYHDLLLEVTMQGVMADYLSYNWNRRKDYLPGTVPDENYAREVMQLFSVGLYQLNPDGSIRLDEDENPLPTYSQSTVSEMARVFTGMGYFKWDPVANPNAVGLHEVHHRLFLEPFTHDNGEKTIIDGFRIPGRMEVFEELDLALGALSSHRNVGPFLSRFLIQRFVTSNPSPGYIFRVAEVFDNNGQGVRGDLGAVLKAILLDYEARNLDFAENPTFGKMREPMFRYMSLMRMLDAHIEQGTKNNEVFREAGDAFSEFWQAPFFSPSVFNFFQPDYQQTGEIQTLNLDSPEFQIYNESSAMSASNAIYDRLFEYTDPGAVTPDGYAKVDLSEYAALAEDIDALLDRLDLLLLSGRMSDGLRAILKSTLEGLTDDRTSPAEDGYLNIERARTAIYLIHLSPEYLIQK